MGEVSTIGLDIAKSIFQVHGVDVDGAVVIRRRINRAKILEFFAALPSCLSRNRGVSERTSLEPRASGARPHRKTDATRAT
jgi:transposase